MIEKVNKAGNYVITKIKKDKDNVVFPTQTCIEGEISKEKSPVGKLLHTYYVPFKGSVNNEKLAFIEESMTPKAEEVYERAKKIAKKYGHKDVQQLHILKVFNDMFIEIINKMNQGDLEAINPVVFRAPDWIKDKYGQDIFNDYEKRKLFNSLLKEEDKFLTKELSKLPKSSNVVKTPKLTKDFVNDIYNSYKMDNSPDEMGVTVGTGAVEDIYLFARAVKSSNEKVCNNIAKPYFKILSDGLIRYNNPKKSSLKFFEDRNHKIWKNLSVGTNMFILYNSELNKDYMLDTFEHVLSQNKEGFGQFNKNNTIIKRYNNNLNVDFLIDDIKAGLKDKNKNYVFLVEYNDIISNESEKDMFALEQYLNELPKYPNIKFVITCDKNYYYEEISDKKTAYKDFSQVSIPIINAEQAKKMFQNEKILTANYKKEFSQKAIDKIIEASDNLEGFFPEKAQRVMRLLSNYYADKKEIKSKDVVKYINEAKEIFKFADKDQTSVQVILNTGVKLKDIVGLKTTQKEAASIVRQIKDKSIGTKGYIIYSQDRMSGSGRNHTAKAIAGEAKIPFLEINAVDFGTNTVSIFDDNIITPESAMKKLFSMAKSQAETNPQKALVLYVQNFEYFSCGKQVSEYHEKAMSQLLKEMDSAQKQGLNIIVMGAVSNPDLIGESTMKSFKFVDKIEVESTARNKHARKDVIDYYLNKKNVKINAKTPQQRQTLLDSFSELTEYMSMIEIMTLIDKVKNVSKERGHKVIDKGDFIEAYLQITCGRPGMEEIKPFSKEMVTSHECGHAITQTIMNEICSSLNPWSEPSHVSFITLDPRSDFGGAVFPANPDHFEYPFERIFSSVVMAFGGYSCEKTFYGMDGSYGITSDIEQATNVATNAVVIMGMGYNFGKKSIGGSVFMGSDDKYLINKDINAILKNAQTVSNLIVEEYGDFIKQFTKKYSSKVGTGECIISGDIFRKELAKWRESLPKESQDDLLALNDIIKGIIKDTQKGIAYNPQ